MKVTSLKKERGLGLATFLVALLTASLCFIPFMLMHDGYFIFFGDFNVQQIPFYQSCHEAVRSGNIFWSSTTDLGANFIGSYSFYLLGSPFFWVTLLFPNNFVPYLLGPLLILKFAFAALTAYLYIRRFTKAPQAAMLGGLLYAFSGFSVYNIFFNHFHEVIIVFPLLLLGVELFCAEKRHGVLALTVFAAAFINYFFFFGMVVFVIIYYLIKMLSGCWKFSFGRFLLMMFECVLGLAMSAALLLPALGAILGNGRITEFLTGWGGILYGKESIYGNIIQCFFFPPDLPAKPVFFPEADVKWSSLGGWLPLMGMTGVFTWMQGKRGHWLRRVIGVMIFMALVPVLNSAFYALNAAYYARWFYMPILMMALSTAMSIEDREVNWWSAYRWCLFITLGITLVVALFPAKNDGGNITLGLYTQSEDGVYLFRFIITAAVALISLIIVGILIPLIKNNIKFFYKTAIPICMVITVLYTAFFISSGQSHSYLIKDVMIDSLIEGEIDLDDDGGFRVDTYDSVDNTAMFYGFRSINAFHSIVPSSVTEFYEFLGEDRSVASRPSAELESIRPLLSVKYVLNLQGQKPFETAEGTLMPGYTYKGSESGHDIYENYNYIPMGFAYDYYMTEPDAKYFGDEHIDEMMLKAILLDSKQITKYRNVLPSIKSDYDIGNISLDSKLEKVEFDYENYAADCKKLAENSCSNFEYTNYGFKASITLKDDNLVFFSVPYDKGFSATVNGKPAEIEKVNVGFMAVLCEKGENEIVFTYNTPGLNLGVKISLAAFSLFAIYIITMFIVKKIKPALFTPEYPEGEELKSKFLTYEMADIVNSQDESTPENSGDTPPEDIANEEELIITPTDNNPTEETQTPTKATSPDISDEEFFKEIDHTGRDQGYYGGIPGGFIVDDTVLDDEDID